MPSPLRRAAAVFVVSALVLAAGCGTPVGKPAGKVTWKGAPVAGAEVKFEPAAAPEKAAYGTTGPDGAYHLDYRGGGGLPVGGCRVTVVRYTLPDGNPLPGGEQGVALKAEDGKVRARTYTFDVDVGAGSPALDFELTAGKESPEPKK